MTCGAAASLTVTLKAIIKEGDEGFGAADVDDEIHNSIIAYACFSALNLL